MILLLKASNTAAFAKKPTRGIYKSGA